MRIARSENTVARWRKLVMHATLSVVLAAVSVFFPVAPAGIAASNERSLYLYYTHTGETARITFKRNGRYVQSGLKKLNRFLRDWRRNEPTKMDPKLFDLVWEVYRDVRATKPIHVVSAYRSPKTNAMLRSRSRGVAKNSRHTKGQAMDFFIPGVPIAKLRRAAMKKQFGGVGYYPTSASPFVHLDTGSVRAWPRMSRNELKRLFPSGRTLHLPRDGRPLSKKGMAYAAKQWRKCHRVPCRGGSNYNAPAQQDIVVATAQKSPGITDKPSLPKILPSKPRAVQLIAQRIAGIKPETPSVIDTQNAAIQLAEAQQKLEAAPVAPTEIAPTQIADANLEQIELPNLPQLPVRDARRIQLATQRVQALQDNLQLAGSVTQDTQTFAQPSETTGLRLGQTPATATEGNEAFAQPRILLSDQTQLAAIDETQQGANQPRLLMTPQQTQLASVNPQLETSAPIEDVASQNLALASTFEALENGIDEDASKALEDYIKRADDNSEILNLNEGLNQIDRNEDIRLAAQPSEADVYGDQEINNIILAAYAQIDTIETGSISAQELESIKHAQAQQAQFISSGHHDLVAPDIEHVHEIYVGDERLHEARYAIMWMPDDGYVSANTVYGDNTKKVRFSNQRLPGLSTTSFQKNSAFSVAELN